MTAPHDAHSCSLSASSFLLLPPFLYKCPSGGQVGRQKRKVQKGQRGNSNGVLRRSTHPMPKMASGEAQQNAGTPEDRNAKHHGEVQRHRHVGEDRKLHNGCQQLVDVDKPVGVFRRQVCRRAGPCRTPGPRLGGVEGSRLRLYYHLDTSSYCRLCSTLLFQMCYLPLGRLTLPTISLSAQRRAGPLPVWRDRPRKRQSGDGGGGGGGGRVSAVAVSVLCRYWACKTTDCSTTAGMFAACARQYRTAA